jgi:antitoxin (DNA-binding transcriptional repressor) of toxin-antitoxin stability system
MWGVSWTAAWSNERGREGTGKASSRRVKAGETIIITEHGKPVGQIVPIRPDLKSRLRGLADAGMVAWNGEPVPHYRPKAVNRGGKLLSDVISEDRD